MSTTICVDAVAPSLKLTRKGRRLIQASIGFIAAVLAALITAALWSQPSLAPAAAADHMDGENYEQIIVQPGDTLWGISARLSQHGEQGVVLEQIVQYNDLDSSKLDIGQVLHVPAAE